MRDYSDDLAAILTGSREVTSTVAVLFDGSPVFDEIPIAGGTATWDSTQEIPGAVEIELPKYAPDSDGRVVDLTPTKDPGGSILNADGTQLAVSYHVGLPGKDRETIGLGTFRVEDWNESDDGTIGLSTAGLEALIAESRLLDPVKSVPGNSYQTIATRLVADLLPLEITADPARISGKQSFEDERLTALTELVTAWPARKYVDDSGVLVIAAPYDDATDPVVATLTDGKDGTVVKRPRSGTRDGVYNAVKASGETSGTTAPVSAVAYLSEGPRRWNGPYGNVPYFYSSPLLTTKAQCRAAAKTRLTNLQVLAEPVTITCAPDPRYQTGDVIELRFRGAVELVRIDVIGLPLIATGGAMTITGHRITRPAVA